MLGWSLAASHCLAALLQQPAPAIPAVTGARLPAVRDTLRIAAVGDLNLGRTVTWRYLLKGDTLYPFRALRDSLLAADILFGNLESPIAPPDHAYEQTGSTVFTAPPVAADALERAGFDVVSDANNHAWDDGLTGVVETLRQLDRVGLAHAGTGLTVADARRPVILERHGWRVAFVAATQAFNPAPTAFYSHQGSGYVAWADSTWLYPTIRRLKESGAADVVVVSVHGGMELSLQPDAELQELFRGAVDAGADLCLGHHPHVLQPMEWYRGKPIVYSMGNFIFRQAAPWTNLSAIFRFTVLPNGSISLNLVPVRSGFRATLATAAQADSIRHRLGVPAPVTPTLSAP